MAERQSERERIVVGVDGSEGSKQALDWAVRQAELTGGWVEAVIAWDVPQFHGGLGWMPPSSSDEAALEERARSEVTSAVEGAVAAHPTVQVSAVAGYGSPASVLLEASRDAALLVVGSRGLGGFKGLLLGSVAQHCVQHAHCPVLVLRGRRD
ncbi:universal stress protein [Streptomyces malaysiense]|uniref:Universal stress protein UspA n=1 Tax=Streptomyces malaysiense TaxID=1428626 RepID=A0A1J4Q1J5_9ACTN|nr:universal stress protein [Streptomyces malaysiense]OIK26031.1 universal stress protein UspA [Streptomyces malaysiense]